MIKPINMGTVIFHRDKEKFKINLHGEKKKFASLQETIDYADSELRKMVLETKKSMTVTIKDKDNYLSSNLVVTYKKGKVDSEIVSRSLFELENRRYFTAEEIEAHLPLRKINANGVARVNLSRARKSRKPFIIFFTALMLSSIFLFIFSAMKINGIGISKIDILKKLMQGKADHDIYNLVISVVAFVMAIVMLAYTAYIHFKRFEIRKHGTYMNDEWSRLYVNNEIRKQLIIVSLSALLAASIAQVVLLHVSYVFSVYSSWYVAAGVVTASYVQIAIITTMLVLEIIKYVTSKRRFVRRLRRFFGFSYIKFLQLVRAKEHIRRNTNLFKDKDLAIRVKGVPTRFPKDGSLTERRVHRLPNQMVRRKLWAKELIDRKKIKETLKENKKNAKKDIKENREI